MLHSCRQGKAQQPLTALFINSIQERRTRSNQRCATHIHVSTSSNQHISLLCAPEMRHFLFVFGRSTNVAATRTTADRHTHTHAHNVRTAHCYFAQAVKMCPGQRESPQKQQLRCFSQETSATSGASTSGHRPAVCQAYSPTGRSFSA